MQIDQEFLINAVMTNLKHWKDLFRTIRQDYDCDKNGFISMDEMIEQFTKFYPE